MALPAETIYEWTLGDRLRKARLAAGLDQEQMAERIGVSRPTVSKWERDKSEPTASQLRSWSEVTNYSVSWLLILGYKGETAGERHLSSAPTFGRRRDDGQRSLPLFTAPVPEPV